MAGPGPQPASTAGPVPRRATPERLVIRMRLDDLIHGSCRKPLHPGQDALPPLDGLIESNHTDPSGRTAPLLMIGVQIYADGVAGPMLAAIHQVIGLLGLYPERLEGATVADRDALARHRTLDLNDIDSEICR